MVLNELNPLLNDWTNYQFVLPAFELTRGGSLESEYFPVPFAAYPIESSEWSSDKMIQ